MIAPAERMQRGMGRPACAEPNSLALNASQGPALSLGPPMPARQAHHGLAVAGAALHSRQLGDGLRYGVLLGLAHSRQGQRQRPALRVHANGRQLALQSLPAAGSQAQAGLGVRQIKAQSTTLARKAQYRGAASQMCRRLPCMRGLARQAVQFQRLHTTPGVSTTGAAGTMFWGPASICKHPPPPCPRPVGPPAARLPLGTLLCLLLVHGPAQGPGEELSHVVVPAIRHLAREGGGTADEMGKGAVWGWKADRGERARGRDGTPGVVCRS